jgi:hypothetical protein
MNSRIADEFHELIQERSNLKTLIDNVIPTDYGCSYLFDGYMPCHVVFYHGRYADVQDQVDPLMDIAKFNRYDSILSLVLNMEQTLLGN